ncbi:hypothetical protein Tamer19_56420 [Cupriavidus sp. TA19]|uniref:type VI secretion system baseplate subunit TssE n=1 Tax=unclassified Cupriavidus TaxID=2640874 RepID=UPI000E2EBE0B|nr:MULTISPECIES: type VI secretion system baseplate subunit TssE [unclassified Cupriavidus]BDB30037.1 type VI secretion system baseplate subunit TssE [Cupriavidus sp. P-10]GLC96233.1 hypothetical protein Tamer19_56420 [Cupriavidus sp. TA19]
MATIISGAPVPLFERLASGGTEPSAHLLDGAQLRQSVARELGRLLNTRSRLSAEAFLASEGTVLDYGLPDCSSRSLQSGPDRALIAALVRHAVTLFEPRLRNVNVEFVGTPLNSALTQPVLLIDGELCLGQAPERVSFELAAGDETATLRGTDHG